MTTFVFAGPTLRSYEVVNYINAVVLPPVVQGDVYRLVRNGARAIGIVDGYFERVPSVWHKEILWALSSGIPVFGSASMGALRAAELDVFGMVGVGRIYQWYSAGEICHDDEVAVSHSGPEEQFRASSEALVNIRATLEHALRSHVISSDLHRFLLDTASSLFYADRNYPALITAAVKDGFAESAIERFSAWLRDNRVDQKREDAIEMLETMREAEVNGSGDTHRSFFFSRTESWETLVRASHQLGTLPDAESLLVESIADELRNTAGSEGDLLDGVARLLILEEAERLRIEPSTEARTRASEALKQRLGIDGEQALEEWLSLNGLSRSDFLRLSSEQAVIALTIETLARVSLPHLIDHLCVSNRLASLRERGRNVFNRHDN